jgi:hypothetical protein
MVVRRFGQDSRPSANDLQHNLGGMTAMTENSETAILAGGCFWPAQELMRHRDGVICARVGYTGGQNDNPTADNHPGHAEAVEVIFDPGRTSYQNILEFFFQIHRPDLGEERVGQVSGRRHFALIVADRLPPVLSHPPDRCRAATRDRRLSGERAEKLPRLAERQRHRTDAGGWVWLRARPGRRPQARRTRQPRQGQAKLE